MPVGYYRCQLDTTDASRILQMRSSMDEYESTKLKYTDEKFHIKFSQTCVNKQLPTYDTFIYVINVYILDVKHCV